MRKAEHRALRAEGDNTLARTQYLWLYSQENLPDFRRAQLRELMNQNLKVALAWAIKEALRHLWDYRREAWARRYFKPWFHWARIAVWNPCAKSPTCSGDVCTTC